MNGINRRFGNVAHALPTAAALLFLACLLAPRSADAQIVDRLKETAEDAAEDELRRQVEEFVENAVKCVFSDLDCIRSAEEGGEDMVLTDEKGEVLMDEDGRPVTDPEKLPPEKRAMVPSTYDFEPGERTIFQTGFAGDRPGDFPRELAFLGGNMTVVETPEGPFLRAESQRAGLAVPLGETLPEQFTIEFDATDPHRSSGIAVLLVRPSRARQDFAGPQRAFFVAGRSHGSGIYGPDNQPISVTPERRLMDEVLPVRIMVDGGHAKMFVGTERVANVPRVDLSRSDSLFVFFHANPGSEAFPMIGNIRVAAGGRDLYEVLEVDGRVAVRDILFDTGEAEIRSQSAEVLAEIAEMLAAHPGLRLMIEGHTDDQGEFDANMELSAERAAAVKRWLMERHGVDAERLRTMGLGPTQPMADNATEEGRQRNRRVELVRMGGG